MGTRGPYLEQVTQRYRSLRISEPKKAQVVLAAAAGAMWSEAGKVRAGLQADDTCVRCGEGNETFTHRYWECPENCRLELSNTDHFKGLVKDQPEWNALWTRGVLRRDLIEEIVTEEEAKKTEISQCIGGGDPDSLRAGECEKLNMFTDASGGSHTSNKFLRRVGWGFTIVEYRKPQKVDRARS